MDKAELHRQIDAMTDEEAAEVKLIYAPGWQRRGIVITGGAGEPRFDLRIDAEARDGTQLGGCAKLA